jgi:hypothetical protein
MDTPTLLNTHNAAEYLGVSSSTLEHWRTIPTGPDFVRLGHQVRYRTPDLERYLDQQLVSQPQ